MKAKRLERLKDELFKVKLTSIQGGWMLDPHSGSCVWVGWFTDKCQKDIKTIEE